MLSTMSAYISDLDGNNFHHTNAKERPKFFFIQKDYLDQIYCNY